MTGVVLDTSALVAILREQSARDALLPHLDRHTDRLVSAPTAVELGIVLEARVAGADGTAARVLRDLRAQYIACDEDLAERAIRAWRRFGKGRHAAALNVGDCVTCALADRTGHPILCLGDDFARTDLAVLTP